MKRRAYISVYNKSGLADFVQNLVNKFNYEIIASHDTYEYLKKSDVIVTDINECISDGSLLSGDLAIFNERLLAGIVKSGSEEYSPQQLENLAVKTFDMVVVNLPQIKSNDFKNINIDEYIENIDAAGVALLQIAAKNYKNITVITDKIDYYVALNANEFGRLKLASKAMSVISEYNRYLSDKISENTGEKLYKIFNFEKIKNLDCGENSHQSAAIYKNEQMIDYEVLFDKELSYNNIINITEVVNIVSEFYDVNAVAVVKHSEPCGVALGRSLYEAYTKAFDCDPLSCFSGTFGFSKPVDYEIAKHINSMAVEVIVAPDFDEKAIELLQENPEIKLVKLNTELSEYRKLVTEEIIVTPFGTLIQDKNSSELKKDLFEVVTSTKPTVEQIEDAVFAWKIAKYAKTNSVVIARDFKTNAISQGSTNTLQAVEAALNYACDGSKEAVLASDDVISAEDSIYAAAQGRISVIIQPGGSIKDQKIVELCNKYNIAMITTGIKNYRH